MATGTEQTVPVVGRVEDWRADFRLRWLFRRFRGGPQSGCHRPVSSPRRIERSVRDAFELGPQSPQFNTDLPPWCDPSPQSEDCLCLNVWTPNPFDKGVHLPVMLWIHGGGFVYGSAGAPMYDGHNLSKTGNVVVVSVNHRLNVFGYLYLPQSTEASANVGQLDLAAALQWIHDNIEHFGGNPNNITAFGQSGGGGKINALMAMPAGAGRFQKAIIQSGSLLTAQEPPEALDNTDQLCRRLGLKGRDVTALKKVPASKLLAASKDLRIGGRPAHPGALTSFSPVADGEVLPRQPWAPSAPDASRGIPMIIGSNLDETMFLIGYSVSDPIPDDRALLDRIERSAILSEVPGSDLRRLLSLYRQEAPGDSNAQLLVRISTDLGFWRNAILQTTRKVEAGGAPVFMYQFDWKTPCFGGEWTPHGDELPFVFDIMKYGSIWDGSDSEAMRFAADPDGDRFRLAHQVVSAWTNFARSGDPSSADLRWPAYDSTARATMIFDHQSHIVNAIPTPARSELLKLG